MKTFEEEKKAVIAQAFDLNDHFYNLKINKDDIEIPAFLPKYSDNSLNDLFMISDISFKQYVLHHTNTEEELNNLKAYCNLLHVFELLYDTPEYHEQIYIILFLIKNTYPVLGNDPVLIELSNYFYNFYKGSKEELNPLRLFAFAMRLSNHLIENSIAIQREIKPLKAQEARSIESRPYWNEIKPIFQAYAKELETNPNAQFGVYFYGKQPDRLEGILRKTGEWSDAKIDKETNCLEPESKMYERNYKQWKANFDRWNERRPKGDKEQQLADYFEKTIWKSVDSKDIIISMQNRLDIQEEMNNAEVMEKVSQFLSDCLQKSKNIKKED